MKNRYFDRELSWLSFNYRVLQEADDPSVPLYERIKFLAIFSSNLDEFFRVRVASLRSLLALKVKSQKKLKFNPEELLEKIFNTVNSHQEKFGEIFRNSIVPELNKNNIFLVNEKELSIGQGQFVSNFFDEYIQPLVQPMYLTKGNGLPFLQNKILYLTVTLSSLKQSDQKRYEYAILEIPTTHLPRFIKLADCDGKSFIIYLDDIIRYSLPKIFPEYNVIESYSIKINRDAELYIDDEFTGNLLEKIKKALLKRKTGVASRFLFDKDIPKPMLKFLRNALQIKKEDLIAGGKYHNLNDLFSFPNPVGDSLNYEPLEKLNYSPFENCDCITSAVNEKDHLVYYPYHSYKYLIKFLSEAASDPNVIDIKITLYRVAKNSEVIKALTLAAKNGKNVIAFVELKARFDEESNIYWAKEMEDIGIKVLYSFPGIKVHAKLCLITRKEIDEIKYYAYLATGNFNEVTSNVYCDFGFFTADKRLTDEVRAVFNILSKDIEDYPFNHLLVAKFNMKSELTNLIDNEIFNAVKGLPASIILKANSIEEKDIIRKLYQASKAGVKIHIIVRGICCLVPSVEGLSENISAISIVDRYLEHARIFLFHNDGDEKYYLGSADMMNRNLNRRIEVIFPIYNETIKKTIKDIIRLQLDDNVKARIVNEYQDNGFKDSEGKEIQSQTAIHTLLSDNNLR